MKRIKYRPLQLEQLMLKMKPRQMQEDFWVFSILMDDPEMPTYDQRISVVGTYDQNVMHCARILDGLFMQGQTPTAKIESYCGEAARRFLKQVGEAEMRYQTEKESRPNN